MLLDELPLWVHVREWRFLLTVCAALLAYFLLLGLGEVDAVKAFLTGYTVDSSSDLLLRRFKTVLSGQAATVNEELARSLPLDRGPDQREQRPRP